MIDQDACEEEETDLAVRARSLFVSSILTEMSTA